MYQGSNGQVSVDAKRSAVMLLLTLVICLLPFMLNFLGADFSAVAVAGQNLTNPLDAVRGPLLHILLEWSAVIVASLVLCVSFVHYYFHGDVTIPIVGAAIMSAGIVDGFHVLAASQFIDSSVPVENFVPFTWALSRVFNGTILIAAALLSIWWTNRDSRLVTAAAERRVLIVISVTFYLLALIAVFAAVSAQSLPQTQYPDSYLTRPFDVLPLAMFLLCGALFLNWFRLDGSAFRYVLLLSILPAVATQLHMAFGSSALFDNHFFIGHALKVVSYLIIGAGMFLDLGYRAGEAALKPATQAGVTGQTGASISSGSTSGVGRLIEVGKATLPLGIQLPAAAFILSLVSAFAIGVAYYSESSEALLKKQIENLQGESNLVSPLFGKFYDAIYRDVTFLAGTPPISSLVRAEQEGDTDARMFWQARLESIFSSLMRVHPEYLEVRFIGIAEDGREIASVERRRSAVSVVPASRLQAMIDQNYVLAGLQATRGAVYFSEVRLLRDKGRIVDPQTAVVRGVTPVFDQASGEVFGVVQITVDFDQFIAGLNRSLPSQNLLLLANGDGDYLVHPEPGVAFSFERGERHMIQEAHPDLVKWMEADADKGVITHARSNQARESVGVYSKVNLSEFGVERSLHTLLLYDGATMEQQVNSIRNRSFMLAISLALVILALSVVASRRILRPLIDMSNAVRTYHDHNEAIELPVDSKDEIGVLARAFQNTLVKLDEENQQHQAAQRKAEETAARIEAIVSSAADAIVTIDQAGKIQSFNRSATEIFGYLPDEVIGQGINRLMPAPYADLHDLYLKGYSGEKGSVIAGHTRELKGQRKNGETFPLELSVSEVRVSGGMFFTGVIRDISVSKQYATELMEAKARAEESVKLKSEFLANMSHEIRTPMNGVLGMLNLMLKGDLPTQQRHFANTARASADSLLGVINDILDFSKIEAGKLSIDNIDFNLPQMLKELSQTVAYRAQDKGVELILDVAANVPVMVRGDPGRLRQVLTNLVGNAIKFTEVGEIVVRAGLSDQQVETNQLGLRFKVCDTGIGIPAEQVDNLFDSFTQGDASTTRKYGGTGLGLAIVRQICELMHGRVWVESAIGTGSEFGFDVVLEQSEQQVERLPRGSISGKTVLVVDDNTTNRLVVRENLENWGASVIEAENAMAGLDALETACNDGQQVPIAILDLQMPEVDGADLGRMIRSDSRFDATQMIMMTSIARRGDALEFSEIGFAGYFPKPFSSSDLYDAITLLINNKDARIQDSPMLTRHNLSERIKNDVRILLVEDNNINLEVAVGMLEDLGFTADTAGNGIEALEAIVAAEKVAPYELILMDCQMPEMDGYETTRAIRVDDPRIRNRSIPIIAMTANAMKGDREKCELAGMDDYIPKPIEYDELEKKLVAWIVEVKEPHEAESGFYRAEQKTGHGDTGRITSRPASPNG